jgi:cation transport protein ChaC
MNNEEKKFAHNTLSLKKDYDCLIKSNHQVWLFGYGSLLWKVDNFEYDKMIYGCVRGYRREFWLLSDDHRGTAQKYVLQKFYSHLTFFL